jgi:2',3'-cyclic-nucleotide 2'-phosphodiesterase (5'-nucleotidase family)
MNRITRKDLEGAVNLLNRITNNPAEMYRKEGEEWIANLGNFHISGAYGGVSLHQLCNPAGGIRDVFGCGHVTLRELYDLIHAYRKGIEYVRSEVTA